MKRMRDSKDGTYDEKQLPRVDSPRWTCHGKKTVHIISIIGVIADFMHDTLSSIGLLSKV